MPLSYAPYAHLHRVDALPDLDMPVDARDMLVDALPLGIDPLWPTDALWCNLPHIDTLPFNDNQCDHRDTVSDDRPHPGDQPGCRAAGRSRHPAYTVAAGARPGRGAGARARRAAGTQDCRGDRPDRATAQ